MADQPIRFEDGAAYERFMGAWSQLVGSRFLDWLAPSTGWRWLDVGCGNGAFTEMLVDRCLPSAVHGIDPSEAQLAFARTRPAARLARFQIGDAMALPFPDDAVDAAVMPLVIFFVPEPAIGVAEMARVVRPGGVVAAYAWDLPGGGFPYQALLDSLREMGISAPEPPNPDASRLEVLHELWTGAGLTAVETREITVERSFADFEDYWATVLTSPSAGEKLKAMPPEVRTRLTTLIRSRLPADPSGRITCTARANAVKGRVPGA
jgi:SAM-dependent methyltransferase